MLLNTLPVSSMPTPLLPPGLNETLTIAASECFCFAFSVLLILDHSSGLSTPKRKENETFAKSASNRPCRLTSAGAPSAAIIAIGHA